MLAGVNGPVAFVCSYLRVSAGNADESWEPVDGMDQSGPGNVGCFQPLGFEHSGGTNSSFEDTLLTGTERVVAGTYSDGASVVRHDQDDGIVVDSL